MNKEDSSPTYFDWSSAAKLIAAVLATMTFCLPTFGQTINAQSLTSLHLPRATREQLIQRFELFVEYEKAKSYDKQYDLVSEEHLADLRNMKVNRESYVKFKQESQRAVGELIELKVNRIKRISSNPDRLSLSIVARLQKGQKTYSDTPICEVHLVNGYWRFWLEYVN